LTIPSGFGRCAELRVEDLHDGQRLRAGQPIVDVVPAVASRADRRFRAASRAASRTIAASSAISFGFHVLIHDNIIVPKENIYVYILSYVNFK
jgi:hypothetical protein